MVIPILLQILKIIGIAVLVIISVVLLLVGLVLFVPIRYRLSFERTGAEEDPPVDVKGRISWLLHILHISAYFKNTDDYGVTVRIFGIPVFRIPAKPDKEKKDKKKKETEPGSAYLDEENTDESAVISDDEAYEPLISEDIDALASETDEDEEDENKSIFSRAIEALNKIKYTISDTYDKIKNGAYNFETKINELKKNIHYYHTILTSDLFERTFEKVKKKLIRLLKELRPRKCSIYAELGFDDPYTTGEVLSIAGILYPIIGEYVRIASNFEEEIIRGCGIIKGRIFVFSLAKLGIYYLTDRDLKKLIRLLKKEPPRKSGRKNHKEE